MTEAGQRQEESSVCVLSVQTRVFTTPHFSFPPFPPPLSQLDTPVILSPQFLMFLLVYVIIYKLTLWNMND